MRKENSPYLTTRIKQQLNSFLGNVGLQVGTTASLLAEKQHLDLLDARGHWNTPRYDQGLKLNPEKFISFLRDTCPPFKPEYSRFAHHENGNEREFYLNNEYFRSVDAELLYSVIRKYQPNHIVEVGSGFSTRLMVRAIKEGQLPTTITSIDPAPRTSMPECVTQHIESLVEHMDPKMITDRLSDSDVLFVDSSHVVRSGGDVPFLFLEIMPRLKPGVLIHVHDVHLPFEYPRQWIRAGWGWNEQYLVHAFLYDNDAFEILWLSRYMIEYYKEAVLDVIPCVPDVLPPSSLWLRKTA